MARRIKLISPFEVLTGNLSGKQELTYPTKDNSAWYAPENKRSYATNYVPRYVGVQRADGTTFFVVKKRSAIKNTLAQKRAQAVLGGTKVYIDAIDRDETMSLRLGLLYVYQIEQGYLSGDPTSNKQYKAWVRSFVERILKTKIGEFTVPGPFPSGAQQVILGNPWVRGSVPTSAKFVPSIPMDIKVKFWKQLTVDGYTFQIDGYDGVSFTDETFYNLINDNDFPHNNLALSVENVTVGGETYDFLKFGSLYVIDPDANENVYASDEVSNGKKYATKDFYLPVS